MMYNIGKRLYMIFYYISCFCNNSWKVSQNQIRVRFGTVKSLNTKRIMTVASKTKDKD